MQSAMPQSSPKTPSRSRPTTRDTHGEKTPTPDHGSINGYTHGEKTPPQSGSHPKVVVNQKNSPRNLPINGYTHCRIYGKTWDTGDHLSTLPYISVRCHATGHLVASLTGSTNGQYTLCHGTKSS